MSAYTHREKLFNLMPDNSMVICYSGIPIHSNEDDYYPFEVNSQFYYLTGIEWHNMVLVMNKTNGICTDYLFIEESDPSVERWTGKMPSIAEVKEISGISSVKYLEELNDILDTNFTRTYIDTVYFDTYKESSMDLPDYNLVKANEFKSKYLAIKIMDLHRLVLPLRRVKDEEEIDNIKKAIDITKQGLLNVMSNIKPGMMEYQVQADFEYVCRKLGARKFAFPTIAGSGLNGCMLHYETNQDEICDGELILLDLGAKYKNYCSDITRTYPVNGRFSKRQREYYEIVLKANKEVTKAAKPGVTLRDLQKIARDVIGEGLMKMGKINSKEEVGKYYMHGVSHSIGIDAHDINLGNDCIEAGWVISNEPGVYIDEENIGIRIEDDLLITEDGCVVLSQDIIREPDEIEEYITNANK